MSPLWPAGIIAASGLRCVRFRGLHICLAPFCQLRHRPKVLTRLSVPRPLDHARLAIASRASGLFSPAPLSGNPACLSCSRRPIASFMLTTCCGCFRTKSRGNEGPRDPSEQQPECAGMVATQCFLQGRGYPRRSLLLCAAHTAVVRRRHIPGDARIPTLAGPVTLSAPLSLCCISFQRYQLPRRSQHTHIAGAPPPPSPSPLTLPPSWYLVSEVPSAPTESAHSSRRGAQFSSPPLCPSAQGQYLV